MKIRIYNLVIKSKNNEDSEISVQLRPIHALIKIISGR